MLLVFAAPRQLPLLAGPEHGQTIPLADIDGPEIPQCSSLLPHHVLSFVAAQEEVGSARPRFRTIQVCPKESCGPTRGHALRVRWQSKVSPIERSGRALRMGVTPECGTQEQINGSKQQNGFLPATYDPR